MISSLFASFLNVVYHSKNNCKRYIVNILINSIDNKRQTVYGREKITVRPDLPIYYTFDYTSTAGSTYRPTLKLYDVNGDIITHPVNGKIAGEITWGYSPSMEGHVVGADQVSKRVYTIYPDQGIYYIRAGVYSTPPGSIISCTNIHLSQADTSYEPYTESLLYPEPITLRSLPNGVRDTIEGGKLIQRVSEDGETELATPEITEHITSGVLTSNPSGTVYLEHALADAGMYTDRLTVLRADFPIDQLESIRKVDLVTGGLVPLYISEAVVAGNGLSFTHPELAAGDIVFFVYHYNYSGPSGENSYSYYDSRYVIADSSNGKYYKWQVTSANGVASIGLVETNYMKSIGF